MTEVIAPRSHSELEHDSKDSKEPTSFPPLSHEWCLYCDDGNFYGGKAQNYFDQMVQLGCFNTVENFWRFFNATEETLRRLAPEKFNMRMFKNGIKPMWEDPSNRKGGKFVISCPLGLESTLQIWKEVLVAAISGFPVDSDLHDLCGCVLVGRRERMEVQLWTKKKPNTETLEETCETIRRLTRESRVKGVQFISHQKAKKKRSKRLATASAVISLLEERKTKSQPATPMRQTGSTTTTTSTSSSPTTTSTATAPQIASPPVSSAPSSPPFSAASASFSSSSASLSSTSAPRPSQTSVSALPSTTPSAPPINYGPTHGLTDSPPTIPSAFPPSTSGQATVLAVPVALPVSTYPYSPEYSTSSTYGYPPSLSLPQSASDGSTSPLVSSPYTFPPSPVFNVSHFPSGFALPAYTLPPNYANINGQQTYYQVPVQQQASQTGAQGQMKKKLNPAAAPFTSRNGPTSSGQQSGGLGQFGQGTPGLVGQGQSPTSGPVPWGSIHPSSFASTTPLPNPSPKKTPLQAPSRVPQKTSVVTSKEEKEKKQLPAAPRSQVPNSIVSTSFEPSSNGKSQGKAISPTRGTFSPQSHQRSLTSGPPREVKPLSSAVASTSTSTSTKSGKTVLESVEGTYKKKDAKTKEDVKEEFKKEVEKEVEKEKEKEKEKKQDKVEKEEKERGYESDEDEEGSDDNAATSDTAKAHKRKKKPKKKKPEDEKENEQDQEQDQESQSLLSDVTHSPQKPKQRKKEKVLPPRKTPKVKKKHKEEEKKKETTCSRFTEAMKSHCVLL